MRIITFFLFSIFLFAFKNDEEDFIIWREDIPLSWKDFKGKPERRFAAASTSYDILKSIHTTSDSSIVIDIKAVFLKKKSWRKKNWVNDLVLQHEQKHFDIVEVFARKLRKSVSENVQFFSKMVSLQIDSLYKENEKALDVYQDLYDNETDGSMNGDMQRKWNLAIGEELILLNAYKTHTIKLKNH